MVDIDPKVVDVGRNGAPYQRPISAPIFDSDGDLADVVIADNFHVSDAAQLNKQGNPSFHGTPWLSTGDMTPVQQITQAQIRAVWWQMAGKSYATNKELDSGVSGYGTWDIPADTSGFA